MLRAFGHPVAMCCDVLRHVGFCWLKLEASAKRSRQFNATDSNIVCPVFAKMVKFATTPNMSQRGGQNARNRDMFRK